MSFDVNNLVVVAGEAEIEDVVEEGEEMTEDESTAHLNYRGPGQDLPGPGLVLPASPQSQPSSLEPYSSVLDLTVAKLKLRKFGVVCH